MHFKLNQPKKLGLFAFFKITFTGTPAYYVSYVHFMIKNLHYLCFGINHPIIDNLNSL